MSSREVSYLTGSATTHTILHERHYFTNLIPKKAHLTTLSGSSNLIEGYGKTCIMLSNATILTIKEALYSPRFGRTLMSYRDIRDNQYHLETTEDNGFEFFCITSYEYAQKYIHEKLERLPSRLYITTIRGIEAHNVVDPMPEFQDTLLFWHDCLGHPGRDMMRRILKSSHRPELHPYVGLPPCKTCSLGKLNTQPSHTKIIHDPPKFLQRIQGDICGPIQPTCEPFRYFMMLVDALTKWSHVCLFSTRNAAFAKLLA
ncbi:hypothetical protein ACFXTH_025893 [Malus domestica]